MHCSGRPASGACFPFLVVLFNLHQLLHTPVTVPRKLQHPPTAPGVLWPVPGSPVHSPVPAHPFLLWCQITSCPLCVLLPSLCPPALSLLLRSRHSKALGLYQPSVLVTSSNLVSFSSIMQPTQEKGHFGSQACVFKFGWIWCTLQANRSLSWVRELSVSFVDFVDSCLPWVVKAAAMGGNL